ncbi:hypothetical protein KHA90_18530 [Flavobacterium psychroterrae]|uniref:DUF3592 domain-containing protein n=1 Tax=Flavobacterium psychroterrae TaxID=2133767 RepID=A0ABS5PFE3_9FLAO|nr:hypothetical protein [Flavobacterium psychroterrae]MBS7233022.1 hypothetical protein [Flavobacterium psychroterrae]
MKKIYLLLVVINILILPIIFLSTAYKQYSYLTGNYAERIMRIEKCTSGSSSKRISTSVEGKINNQKVSFGLYDDDAYDFLSYLKNDRKKYLKNSDYNDLTLLKLNVRVVQFGDSKNVLYLKKEETKDEIIKKKLYPWIFIEFFIISLLLIFYFLKKYNKKRN